ncbi:MAG: site-specific integrase, partial [Hyphomicrobiales bacterium]
MATLRKRNDKYQVQIRRKGQPSLTKSFLQRKDAEAWARQMEVRADRGELGENRETLENFTLGDLVIRYRNEITPRKKAFAVEAIVLNAFLRDKICKKNLTSLKTSDFISYRDRRLKKVLPSTLRRQLNPIRHMFETARSEWGVPLKENPLDKVRLRFTDNRRERRLEEGELEKIL